MEEEKEPSDDQKTEPSDDEKVEPPPKDEIVEKKVEVVKMKTAPKNPDDFALILENAEGEKKQIYFENPQIEESNAILEELEDFASAIQNNKPVTVSLENGTLALKLAYQIMECCKV